MGTIFWQYMYFSDENLCNCYAEVMLIMGKATLYLSASCKYDALLHLQTYVKYPNFSHLHKHKSLSSTQAMH